MLYKNPLLTRLISRQAPVPVQLLIGAAAGLGLSAFGSQALSTSRLEMSTIEAVIDSLGILYYFVLPVVTLIAALMTLADIGTEQYQFVRLTTLSDRAILMGYTCAALCRLSIPLLITASSALLISPLLASYEYADWNSYSSPIGFGLIAFSAIDALTFSLPAALWGVAAAFLARKWGLAILAAPVAGFIAFPLVVVFVTVLFLAAALAIAYFIDRNTLGAVAPVLMIALRAAISALCAILLSLLLLHRAAPLARRGFPE